MALASYFRPLGLTTLLITAASSAAIAAALPNDPGFSSQDYLRKIDAPGAWETLTLGMKYDVEPVLVALVDTGMPFTVTTGPNPSNPSQSIIKSLKPSDPDLDYWRNSADPAGDYIDNDGNGFIDDEYGYSPAIFGTGKVDVSDNNGHGTAMARIIGSIGNNGKGSVSPAWAGVKLMSVRHSPNGQPTANGAAQALNYAINSGHRPDIINNSYHAGQKADYDGVMKDAEAAGILLVAAAGNDGRELAGAHRRYPASHPSKNVISVGASTMADQRVGSSNWSSTEVDVFAPGSATSQATALVSGAAALLIADDPTATPEEIRARLIASSDRIPALAGSSVSGGRINLKKALDLNTLRRPGNVTVYAVTPTDWRVLWQDRSTRETGFLIERIEVDPHTLGRDHSADKSYSNAVKIQVPADSIGYYDTVSPNKTYYYRVRAMDSRSSEPGRSGPEYSARNFMTRVTPVTLAIATDAKAANLVWTDHVHFETGYKVYRAPSANPTAFAQIASLPANSTSYKDTSVSSGATYVYKVVATDGTHSIASNLTKTTIIASGDTVDAAWREIHFGFSGQYDDAVDAADPDGDGFTNRAEQAVMTSPSAPGKPHVVPVYSEGMMGIEFIRQVGKSGAKLTVHRATGQNPQWIPAAVLEAGSTSWSFQNGIRVTETTSNGQTTVKVIDSHTTQGLAPIFFRLTVE